MAPDDCERGDRGAGGRRVTPAGGGEQPARAWDESDGPEGRRLLAPVHQTKLPKNTSRCTPPQKFEKPPMKTKYQKRKEKLVAALRPPYFILSMIIIITAVQVWGSERVRLALEWSPRAAGRAPWRLVSYGWVHASGAHAALNALVALAVGWRLEREQGWWRVAAVWAGGVAAGALGAGVLQPSVRVVGASAAVYALLTAHLPNVCLRFGHIPLWWFRPLSVVVLAASEASWALLRDAGTGAGAGAERHEQVAWAAHVLGAAVGVPLSFLVFTGEKAGTRAVAWCRAVSAAVLAAGAALAALYFLHCARGDLR